MLTVSGQLATAGEMLAIMTVLELPPKESWVPQTEVSATTAVCYAQVLHAQVLHPQPGLQPSPGARAKASRKPEANKQGATVILFLVLVQDQKRATVRSLVQSGGVWGLTDLAVGLDIPARNVGHK